MLSASSKLVDSQAKYFFALVLSDSRWLDCYIGLILFSAQNTRHKKKGRQIVIYQRKQVGLYVRYRYLQKWCYSKKKKKTKKKKQFDI